MDKHIVTIDINLLNSEQLSELGKIIYQSNQEDWSDKCQAINHRNLYISGLLEEENPNYRYNPFGMAPSLEEILADRL